MGCVWPSSLVVFCLEPNAQVQPTACQFSIEMSHPRPLPSVSSPPPNARCQPPLEAVGCKPLFGQDCHLSIGCLASQSPCIEGIMQGTEAEVSAPPVPRLVCRPL